MTSPLHSSSYYKPLTRRNLRISRNTELAFHQVIIKGFYLKNLLDSRGYEEGTDEAIYLYLKRKKAFKTLNKLQISSLSTTSLHECIKSSKNLKNFTLSSVDEDTNFTNVASILQKLPSQINSISLQVYKQGSADVQSLFQIAKSPRRFKKLQSFSRDFALDSETDVETELRLYNTSVSQVFFCVSYEEQQSFQEAMRKGRMQPRINGLKIVKAAEILPSFEVLDEYCGSEDIDDDSEILNFDSLTPAQKRAYKKLLNDLKKSNKSPIDLIESAHKYTKKNSEDADEGFIMECIMREEIKPFYRFELFPNLKRLDLVNEGSEYNLGSFVIDSFSSLKNLEELSIDIWNYRPLGMIYTFQALLGLPLLKKFSLRIPFIKDEDWALLQLFLEKQKSLDSLGFEIKRHSWKEKYLKQNDHLKNFLQYLQQKPLLRSLELSSFYWSLYTLAEGLESLQIPDQLHTLIIQTSDNIGVSPKSPLKSVKGLCKFMKNQKNSLKSLQLSLKDVLENTPLDIIFSAISQLNQLRTLDISIELPEKEELDLAHILPHLENLEDFSFEFRVKSPHGDHEWFVEMLSALTKLERLRKIEIKTHSHEALMHIQENIVNVVEELRNIREITFNLWNGKYADFEYLYDAIEYVNQRQSIKSTYMF